MLAKIATDQYKKILLIDDDPGVLKALTLLLTVMGFEVVGFDSSLKAVDFLNQQGESAVHLVVSDLRMPDLDGVEVLKKVKKSYPNLPFILISGHATSDEVAYALSLGACGFIGKPFIPDDFSRVFTERILRDC